MPAAGATAIGTGRIPGQEALDLGVCIALLKKTIVAMPLIIMILLFLIKYGITHHPDQRYSHNDNSTNMDDFDANSTSFSNDSTLMDTNFEVSDDGYEEPHSNPNAEQEKRLRKLLRVPY